MIFFWSSVVFFEREKYFLKFYDLRKRKFHCDLEFKKSFFFWFWWCSKNFCWIYLVYTKGNIIASWEIWYFFFDLRLFFWSAKIFLKFYDLHKRKFHCKPKNVRKKSFFVFSQFFKREEFIFNCHKRKFSL